MDRLTATKPETIRHIALGGVPGFVVVHTPSGYTGYALRYMVNGKRIKLTLGSTKMLSLADARKAAAKYRDEIECGANPHGDKVAARKEVVEKIKLGRKLIK